jgi:hypothetical protein
MIFNTPLTASADAARSMPASAGARLDAASAAVASLRQEQRRLQRMGLETPLARCHQQLRYWSFVRALCALAPEVRA